MITQRDENQAYPAMMQDRDGIIQDIHSFFRQHIYGRFPLNKCELGNEQLIESVLILNRLKFFPFGRHFRCNKNVKSHGPHRFQYFWVGD